MLTTLGETYLMTVCGGKQTDRRDRFVSGLSTSEISCGFYNKDPILLLGICKGACCLETTCW